MPNDHPIFKCDKFVSPYEKAERLKSLNGCTRCGGKNHVSKTCKFTFYRNCSNCNGKNQFNYLCLAKSKSVKSSSDNGTSNVNLHANIGSLRNKITTGVVLPTFSAQSLNGEVFRCLKDSRCTDCFVKESLVERFKWKVIEGITVNVSGLNVDQLYITHVVEVVLKRGENIVKVHAISIPDISLKLSDLGKISAEFESRGHKLADTFINKRSNSIKDIGLILESDFANLIPGTDIVYGIEDNSLINY